MEIAIAHRSASALRCAYCHDRIAGAEPCGGCGTVFHADCRATLGGCPTLGCRRVAPSLRRPPPRERPLDELEWSACLFGEACAWAVLAGGAVVVGTNLARADALVVGVFMTLLGAVTLWLLWRCQGRRTGSRMALLAIAIGFLGLVISLRVESATLTPVGLAVGSLLVLGGVGALALRCLRRRDLRIAVAERG